MDALFNATSRATAADRPCAAWVAGNATAAALLTGAAQVGSAAGEFANLGAGSVSADGATYTVTGTASAVTAALQAVTFTPANGGAAPTQVDAALTDGTGTSVLTGAGTVAVILSASGAGDRGGRRRV